MHSIQDSQFRINWRSKERGKSMALADPGGKSISAQRDAARDEMIALAENWCRQMALMPGPRLEDLVTADCVVSGLKVGGGTLIGAAEIRAVFQNLAEFYPNKSCEILRTIVEGPNIAFSWMMNMGTAQSTSDPDQGQVEGITIFQTEKGKIKEVYTNFGRWWV